MLASVLNLIPYNEARCISYGITGQNILPPRGHKHEHAQLIRPCLVALGPFHFYIQTTVPLPFRNGRTEWPFGNGKKHGPSISDTALTQQLLCRNITMSYKYL